MKFVERSKLHEILTDLVSGRLSVEEAARLIAAAGVVELEDVKIDGYRHMRKGLAETVYCKDKTPEQVASSFSALASTYRNVLGTKARPEHFERVKEMFPEAEFFEQSGIIRLVREPVEKRGYVPVLTAGTSDMPVAEEALLSLHFFGSQAEIVSDVGVAGVHRLKLAAEKIARARAVIVVAGMEGALPSLVAGLSPVPVIGVPTSAGYGANFGGIAPLLTMLNSCAEGLTVVNIDNGFGAACTAHLINMLPEKEEA